MKDLCGQWKALVVKEGLLSRKWVPKHTGVECFQIVAPLPLRAEIFSLVHRARTGGHLGVKRTLAAIRQRFFWPNYLEDVKRWCQECTICAQSKNGPRCRAALQQVPVRRKMERIALDVLGELPTTDNGNKYILVATDYYTKWTHAMAMPDQTAITIADVFVREFIAVFGVPAMIHSDQGRNFEGNVFQGVCSLLGIEKSRTTPFHPESDGQVERFNRTIQQMLKAYVNKEKTDWDDHLPYLCMAYRATPHESTGCTPNLMMFGVENSMPIDVMAGIPPGPQSDASCPTEYVEWLRGTLEKVHQFADSHLEKSAKRQKHHYDLRSKPANYQVGDLVWRWYPPAARGKLSRGWVGPYKVVGMNNTVNVDIYDPQKQSVQRVHVNSLKPYHGPTPPIFIDSPSQSEREEPPTIDSTSEPDQNPCLDSEPASGLSPRSSDSESSVVLGRGHRRKRPVSRYSPGPT